MSHDDAWTMGRLLNAIGDEIPERWKEQKLAAMMRCDCTKALEMP